MKHSRILRNSAKAFFAFAVIGLVSACADSTAVAPTAEAPAFVAPANFVKVGAVTVFRVNNAQGITKRIGNHVINMPADAICDPKTSGYGATSWDKPCNPLRGSIEITATIMEDAQGMPYVDFQPALRFSPSKEVMLFLRQGRNDHGFQLGVEYCNNAGYCMDESLTDRSLKPFRIGKSAVIARRVKHFSGYVIAYEGDCLGTVQPIGDGMFWCDDEGPGGGIGMGRRSGYMVASGEDITQFLERTKDASAKADDDQQ